MPNYWRRNVGAYNASKYSLLAKFYCTRCNSETGITEGHIPLSKWEKQNGYTRKEAEHLIKHHILSCFRFKNQYFVAVAPEFADVDPAQLRGYAPYFGLSKCLKMHGLH